MYSFFTIDTRAFHGSFNLEVGLQVDANSETDGTMDVFADTSRMAFLGLSPHFCGQTAIKKGTTAVMRCAFLNGRVLELGLQGDRRSVEGATGNVTFNVTAHPMR
jgi:hypothetical protein